jgi:hypothetical protein
MSTGDKAFYLAMFSLLPFLIAGAFWLSPWLGVPSLVVGGVYWVGCFLMFAAQKKKGKQ